MTNENAELIAKTKHWQSGIAGRCNLVAFDGDDIEAVARFVRPEDAALVPALRDALEAAEQLAGQRQVIINTQIAQIVELEAEKVEVVCPKCEGIHYLNEEDGGRCSMCREKGKIKARRAK